MTTSILETTQGMCKICHKDFQKGETSDVTKVVELACHHFCHISCILEPLMDQQTAQRKLNCSRCVQAIAPSAEAANIFADQETFQRRLQKVKEEYDYDNEVMEAIPIINSLYTNLHDLFQSLLLENQEDRQKIADGLFDSIVKNEAIRGDLKVIVARVLSAMMTGDGSLRTVKSEANRWRRIPFENWPDKLKKKGVSVDYTYNNTLIPIRISAEHLRREADRFGLDSSLDFTHSHFSWILGGIAVAVLVKEVLGDL